nr:MAG TPA: hypothetical protein [Crassvirales sp.]
MIKLLYRITWLSYQCYSRIILYSLHYQIRVHT